MKQAILNDLIEISAKLNNLIFDIDFLIKSDVLSSEAKTQIFYCKSQLEESIKVMDVTMDILKVVPKENIESLTSMSIQIENQKTMVKIAENLLDKMNRKAYNMPEKKED